MATYDDNILYYESIIRASQEELNDLRIYPPIFGLAADGSFSLQPQSTWRRKEGCQLCSRRDQG
jgi:hypothetical protein